MATLPTEPAQPSPLQGLARMAPVRQGLLLVALAGSIAVGVAAALWIQTPTYVAYGQSFSSTDMPAVSEALERAGIEHRVESGGTVLVEASQAQKAELVLSEAGLAASPPLTLEKLYGQEAGFTQTQEDKRQLAIRAKEIDLARTVSLMTPIASAKVHLAVPRRSPFQRDRAHPSASVMLELRPGRQLAPPQVESIRQLVAQGVEGMDAAQVVVTDQSGRLLGRAGEDEGARETEYVRALEARMVAKIGRILTPIVGPDGFTAEVTAQVDFSREEAYSVTYDGDVPAVRSRTTSEETDSSAAARGVPGALSNQPAPAATAPEVATGQAASASAPTPSGRRRRTETVNQELDKSSRYKRVGSPILMHLSAAIVLDDHRVTGADGKATRRPWTPEELNRVESQIRSAIGVSLERQDVVTVTNTQFAPAAEIAPLPEPPLWQQPWAWSVARQGGAALLALVLVLGVFKPFMRSLVNRDIAEREAEEAAEQARLAAQASADAAERGGGADGRPAALERPGRFERNLDAVRDLVSADPRRAANVVKEWVSGQAG